LIFRKNYIQVTFVQDDNTRLCFIAKNIEQAKKMAEEYSGKPLKLVSWNLLSGRLKVR